MRGEKKKKKLRKEIFKRKRVTQRLKICAQEVEVAFPQERKCMVIKPKKNFLSLRRENRS